MDSRTLIDPVTGVKTNALFGYPFQCRVDRLDIHLRAPLHTCRIETRFDKDVRQEWIIDLHKNAGIDNCPVLLAEFGGHGMEIVFVGFVIFVHADA